MTSTDTTTNAAAAPAETELQKIENAIEVGWADVVAFFEKVEGDLASLLNLVATGAPVVLADVQAAASAVAGKASVINAAATAMGSVMTSLAPSSATTVQKLLDDVNTGVADATALSASLSGNASVNDPAIVTKTVQVIGAVNTLSQLAGVAGAALTAAVQASPTATSVVSPPSLSTGA